MNTVRTAAVLAALIAAAPATAPAQQIDSSVPSVVVRRIAQAIWPRQLFDSLGRPERTFERRAFEPAWEDIRVRRVSGSIAGVPDIDVFVGTAYPDGCSHCRTWVAAVVTRGNDALTMTEPSHLMDLLGWIEPRGLQHDSVAVKRFVLSALGATCLLSCATLQQVRSVADLESLEAQLLRPLRGDGPVEMPRASARQDECTLTLHLAFKVPSRLLYSVQVSVDNCRGLRVFIEVTPFAAIGIAP